MNNYENKTLSVNKKYIKKARFEFLERVWFQLIPTAQGRVKWLRKHKKFDLLGNHVHFQPRKYPTDAQRVKIHDNVAIAADVEFTAHDIIHWVFDGMAGKREYSEYRGCIEVHENVFIGAGTRVLGDVSIGPNAIIAANSLVNRDVPAGEVWGGVPARRIGSFEELRATRQQYSADHQSWTAEMYWEEFNGKHLN